MHTTTIIRKREYTSIEAVSFTYGIILVYLREDIIGSVVSEDGSSVTMYTIYESCLSNSLEELMDSYFDYTFKYVTEE